MRQKSVQKLLLKNLLSIVSIGFLGLLATSSIAASPDYFSVGKPTLACVAQEARNNNIPLAAFLAVNSVERGKTGQAVDNTNSTQDLGAFQINSIHLPMVQQNFGGTRSDLLNKGCFNAHVAGYLMKQALNNPKKQHLDFYSRLAGYHSWTPQYNQIYANKIRTYIPQWEAWLQKQVMFRPQAISPSSNPPIDFSKG